MEIKVTIIDREGEQHKTEAPTDMNFNMMEICKAMELPVEGTCGGKMSEDEEDMLDQAFFVEDNSRLSCQLPLTEELNGLVIRLAPVGQ